MTIKSTKIKSSKEKEAMKLLGWMRHKIQQCSTEPFKEFTPGNYCCLSAQSSLDDQETYAKSCSGSKNNSRYLKQLNQLYENSFSDFEPHGVQELFEDETSIANNELFHGFLAIGTLGTETLVSEPATPTFAVLLENKTEGKEEVTENDLKLISDELEKFLEAEAEEGCNESPGRSSQVSTITLSGRPMEEADAKGNGITVVCPLQGYLFGSSIELQEANIEVKKEKGSLAELFQRTKIVDENSIGKCGNAEMQSNPKHKHGKHLIKKLLKKLHASSSSSTPSKGDFVPKKKMLRKFLQMFHRKIHPETLIAESKVNKWNMHKNDKTLSNGSYISGGLIHKDNSSRRMPHQDSNEEVASHDTDSKWFQYEVVGVSSDEKREHWIKTDAEYLVLEL